MKFVNLIAGKVLAELFFFIAVITAVIGAVTEVMVVDADMVLTFELVLAAIAAVWEPGFAVQLVTEIRAVSESITF